MMTSRYADRRREALIDAAFCMLEDLAMLASEALPDRRKVAYLSVRLCTLLGKETSYRSRMLFCQWAICRLAAFTPRELMTIFPPDKHYDGEKYGCKDYASTMEAVTQHGPDTPLGAAAFEFLYDYMNHHVNMLLVRYIGAIDDTCHAAHQVGPTDHLLDMLDIPVQTLFTAGGRQYMRDERTGRCVRVTAPKPRMPRWWKVIEGGLGR